MKEALQGRQVGWLGLSRGLHDLKGEAARSSEVVQALCRPQACPAEALQDRCRMGTHLSGGLPGLWKVGSRPWNAQVFGGQEACLAEALQGLWGKEFSPSMGLTHLWKEVSRPGATQVLCG